MRAIGAAAAFVLALTLIPVSGAQGDEGEHTHRSGEYLAFVSDRTGNDELYISRPDGGEVEQLTDNPGFDRAPSWGSSGTSLVFNSRRDPHASLPQIYSLDIVTGATTRLTESDQEEHRASVHEESGKLYFHRGIFFRTAFELWEKDLATGAERQLTQSDSTAVWNAAAAVSPDGREVLFQSNRGETEPTGPFPQKLYLLRLDSGEITALPEPEGLDESVSYDGARWNPDGTAIVFSASTAEGSVLHIAERAADGSWTNQAITDPGIGASAPAWSPSGTEIVFQAENPEDDELTDIGILNLTDGSIRTVGEGRTPVWVEVKGQELPAPTLTVDGLKPGYLPGDRLELTAHQNPDTGEDHWSWFMQRAGESEYSVIPSQTTSVLTIEQLALEDNGAQVIAKLVDRDDEVIAESQPVVLVVAEGGQGGEGAAGDGSGGDGGTVDSARDSSDGVSRDKSNQSLLANTGVEHSPLLSAIPILMLAAGSALILRERRRDLPATPEA